MSTPPEAHKAWARHFRSLVPGDVAVARFRDEDETHAIDVVTSTQPDGLVAATIGLMEYDQAAAAGAPLRSELIMDSRGELPELQNVLATAAFFVMKDGWRMRPGVVFERVVKLYRPDLELPHAYFTAPFQWDGAMGRVELPARTIYPLLAVPISMSESRMVAEAGGEALESWWESAGTDVLDWKRTCAVEDGGRL